MTRILIQIFLFLLFQHHLLANSGNLSTVFESPLIDKLPSFQQINDNSKKSIIFWEYSSPIGNKNPQYFTQRIGSGGELLWGKDVELTTKRNKIQSSHKMISDGFGGAIISWEERLEGDQETHIYTQRIDSLGNKLWGNEGKIIIQALGSQISPFITSDKKGGVIIAWCDSRNDPTYNNWDIYAQHISAKGERLWENEGVLISADIKDEFIGKVLLTNDGNVTVVWNMVVPDIVGEGEGYDFYFKKLNLHGEPIPTLTAGKFLSLPVAEIKYELAGDILNDGNNGFFLSLTTKTDELTSSLYVQHVLPTGETAFPEENGLLIDDRIANIQNINYSLDGLGNVVVTWAEKEEEALISYSQKIDQFGNVIQDSLTGTTVLSELTDPGPPSDSTALIQIVGDVDIKDEMQQITALLDSNNLKDSATVTLAFTSSNGESDSDTTTKNLKYGESASVPKLSFLSQSTKSDRETLDHKKPDDFNIRPERTPPFIRHISVITKNIATTSLSVDANNTIEPPGDRLSNDEGKMAALNGFSKSKLPDYP